jgi:hypothetical protein
MFRTEQKLQRKIKTQFVSNAYFMCHLMIVEITEQKGVREHIVQLCMHSDIFHIFNYLNPLIQILLVVKYSACRYSYCGDSFQHVSISNQDNKAVLL